MNASHCASQNVFACFEDIGLLSSPAFLRFFVTLAKHTLVVSLSTDEQGVSRMSLRATCLEVMGKTDNSESAFFARTLSTPDLPRVPRGAHPVLILTQPPTLDLHRIFCRSSHSVRSDDLYRWARRPLRFSDSAMPTHRKKARASKMERARS